MLTLPCQHVSQDGKSNLHSYHQAAAPLSMPLLLHFSMCYDVFASLYISCRCSTWSPKLLSRCFFVLSSESIIPSILWSACASSMTASPVSGRIKSPMTTDWTFTQYWRGRSNSSYTRTCPECSSVEISPNPMPSKPRSFSVTLFLKPFATRSYIPFAVCVVSIEIDCWSCALFVQYGCQLRRGSAARQLEFWEGTECRAPESSVGE